MLQPTMVLVIYSSTTRKNNQQSNQRKYANCTLCGVQVAPKLFNSLHSYILTLACDKKNCDLYSRNYCDTVVSNPGPGVPSTGHFRRLLSQTYLNLSKDLKWVCQIKEKSKFFSAKNSRNRIGKYCASGD